MVLSRVTNHNKVVIKKTKEAAGFIDEILEVTESRADDKHT